MERNRGPMARPIRTRGCLLLLLHAIVLISSSCLSFASDVEGSLFEDGEGYIGLVPLRRFATEIANPPLPDAPPLDNSSFILAANRTSRKDPLDGYNRYSGGWNISNQHYWASVGFTAVPLFLIAAVWFLGFGIAMLLICFSYCCCPTRTYSYSKFAYAMSLLCLILFTLAAIFGCVILYNGQGHFHHSTSTTLDYVVGQANYTVENMRNLSDYLASAKRVKVEQFFLSPDVQTRIDDIQTKLKATADVLAVRTNDNSKKIQNLLDNVGLQLVVVAAVMLFLVFLGFLFSVLGLQFFVTILVLVGWILVAGTFILSGVFLLLHNVMTDSCVAMEEWVQHPHSHTALDDILPCVDAATANESMYRTREVTFQLVNVVNTVIGNISNANFPPALAPAYYNQSGPLAPLLCNPFNPNMSLRNCTLEEVTLVDAGQEWKHYICRATGPSEFQVCTSPGRFTPSVYGQITAAASVCFGLYTYAPFLTKLQDCTFARETFIAIGQNDCPGLSRYSRWVYTGLAMVSAAVMLSLVLWLVYSRERRHRKFGKSASASTIPLRQVT